MINLEISKNRREREREKLNDILERNNLHRFNNFYRNERFLPQTSLIYNGNFSRISQDILPVPLQRIKTRVPYVQTINPNKK